MYRNRYKFRVRDSRPINEKAYQLREELIHEITDAVYAINKYLERDFGVLNGIQYVRLKHKTYHKVLFTCPAEPGIKQAIDEYLDITLSVVKGNYDVVTYNDGRYIYITFDFPNHPDDDWIETTQASRVVDTSSTISRVKEIVAQETRGSGFIISDIGFSFIEYTFDTSFLSPEDIWQTQVEVEDIADTIEQLLKYTVTAEVEVLSDNQLTLLIQEV